MGVTLRGTKTEKLPDKGRKCDSGQRCQIGSVKKISQLTQRKHANVITTAAALNREYEMWGTGSGRLGEKVLPSWNMISP